MLATEQTARPIRFAYVPALDGLRGVLLIVVALFHFSLVAGLDEQFVMFPGSFFGPSTFFTLSGYLITSMLLAERERTGSINRSAFWGRRFRRLLPSSTFVAVVVAAMLVIWPDIWGQFAGSDVAASVAGMANWHSIALADAGEGFRLLGPLGVYWSLSLEEQFYIIMFGLLVFSLGRGESRMRWFVGLLLAVWAVSVCSMWFVVSTPQRELFGTDTRSSEAVVGCLLAVWVHHRGNAHQSIHQEPRVDVDRRCVRDLAFCTRDRSLDPGMGASLLRVHQRWNDHRPQPAVETSRLLSTRPIVLLGRISYPAYIVHWPVALVMNPTRMHMTGWQLIGARFMVAIGIAWLMFRFLELPFKDLRAARFPNGLIMWGVLGAGATLATVAVAGWGWP